jgi:hypothetical protein
MFYKVVEGLVPAIAPNYYLIPSRNKRQISAKQYFVRSNIVERREKRNASSFQITNNNTDILFTLEGVRIKQGCLYTGEGTYKALLSLHALIVPLPDGSKNECF